MKIRKTFVGNLPDNKIVNSNSTSETDTYSCKYLNERNVIVSSKEPTTGEEVWLQRGKNLFDKSNVSFPYCWLDTDGTIGTTINQDAVSEYIKVTPNTTYTISGFANNQYFALHSYDKDKNHSNMIYGTTLTNGEAIMFTTGGNDYYLRLALNIFDVSNNIQLEKGEVATSYEPYVPKKIHTKNDNGYEEFSNITPTIITPTLESIVKSGQITAIKSGNVVVVEVSDLMLNSDRKEWSTTVATGLPKPLFYSGAWRKSTLLENKGLVQIGNSGEVTICTRTGTQSVNDCYIGQITYISEE